MAVSWSGIGIRGTQLKDAREVIWATCRELFVDCVGDHKELMAMWTLP